MVNDEAMTRCRDNTASLGGCCFGLAGGLQALSIGGMMRRHVMLTPKLPVNVVQPNY
jgi:hypothetical protein